MFCEECGAAIRPGAMFCRSCGAMLEEQVRSSSRGAKGTNEQYPDSGRDRTATSRQTVIIPQQDGRVARKIATVVAVIVVAIILLMVVPLPIPWSVTLESSAVSPNGATIGDTDGISLSGSWSTTDGGSVTLVILNGHGLTVYSADASSGSFSLNASDPPYVATALSIFPETVQISGTCWAPIIPVGLP